MTPFVLAACAAETGESIANDQQAISSIHPGDVDLAGTHRMEPNQSRAGFAVGYATNAGMLCTGTMIGPNVMMTASHCGGTEHFEFFSYNGDENHPAQYVTETFTCHYLLNTHPETDLLLNYCEPNDDGESPGLKYGYVDFDLAYSGMKYDYAKSKALVAKDTKIYSYWWNPVTSLGGADEILYSAGTLTKIDTGTGWYNPAPIDKTKPDWGQCDNTQDSVGIAADLYSAEGCSGSALFSVARNRILAGPTSLASEASHIRGMLPIVEYLHRAVVQTPNAKACGLADHPLMVNGTFISDRWGLNAADYAGIVDADDTGVFDIQEDIERIDGEPQRASYLLNFSSSRQNQLWATNSAVSTELGAVHSVTPPTLTPLWLALARHDRLHLKPNKSYHVTFWGASSRPFELCLDTHCSVQTPNGTGAYKRYSAILSTGASGTLFLRAFGGGETSFSRIALVEMETTNGFSTMDERNTWTAPVGFAGTTTATTVPVGTKSSTTADWAGIVRGVSSGWSLQNETLPFSPGRRRVCFDAKSNPADTTDGGTLHVRVLDANVERVNMSVTPGIHACTPFFSMGSADGVVQFSSLGAVANIGGYAVDNVHIEHETGIPGGD